MYKKRVAKEHHLTISQVDLLEKLVAYHADGKLYDPIVPIPAGLFGYKIYVRKEESLSITSLSDLDALVACGMLRFNYNRMGDGKVYHMEKLGEVTIDPKMILPAESLEEQQRKAWARLRRRFMDIGRVLKLSLGQILGVDDLNAVVANLQVIKAQVDLLEPDSELVREHIQQMARLITKGFASWKHSAETADVLQLFGEWSGLAIELLDLEQHQFRLLRDADRAAGD